MMISTPSARTNVNVIHPDPLIALGLATALRGRDCFAVFGSGDGPPQGTPIDVVLTNYEGGVQLARRQEDGRTRIMVVASQDREHEVRHALNAGVHGYLLLGCAVDEVLAGIQALSHGRAYICMEAAQRIAESMLHQSLSSREAEVLTLLADGMCNKSIARDLDIALGTVKSHVKGILSKLNASSRTEAVSIAVARGLVAARKASDVESRRSMAATALA